ncbi:MAG: DNA-processing protein DprA, partial [Thermoguttaceae bacterium]
VAGLIELCRRESIDVISIRDSRYPQVLRTIYDPPAILYVKGEIKEHDALGVAVIGTRSMTSYGKKVTALLTRGLAQYGVTIISGLAKGIDGVAHKTALECDCRTVAVLGNGICRIYPKEHTALADKIAENGALISEYHPLMEPSKGTFPQRNRIVAGLALGVLVTEAPRKSGAMITARLANENGRDIFAVPGNIDSAASQGCHQLLRDGATLVESVDDILETLGPLLAPLKSIDKKNFEQIQTRHPGELQLNEVEHTVLYAVGITPTPLELVIEKSGFLPHQVTAALAVLEDKKIIRRDEETGGFVRI